MAFGNNPFSRPKEPTGWQNGGGHGGNRQGQFMPGQIGGIADDLQMGYGGTDEKWKNYLRNVYSPVPNKPMGFDFAGGGHHGGGNNNGGGNNPGTGPNQPTDGGFDPASPRNRMAPPMPMAMNRAPMQAPQMGLLNAPMQQPQQQGLLGSIDPAILAYLGRR